MQPIRPAAYAGRFYPGTSAACRQMLDSILPSADPEPSIGGLVPHAGWVFSGPTAGRTIAAITAGRPETVVVFGAVHVPTRSRVAVFSRGSWQTPLGLVHVDSDLADEVLRSPMLSDDADAHRYEHSIEVELPLIQSVLSQARILPVMVVPGPWASEVGRVCADAAESLGRRVCFLASTDLTHYGPAFGFEPAGRGWPGIRWAKKVNDRRFVRLVSDLDDGGVVPEAEAHRNACGAGAVAAAIAAACRLGAGRYEELAHTTSAEREGADESTPVWNSVGYHAGVFRI